MVRLFTTVSLSSTLVALGTLAASAGTLVFG
jgi:hypothetical protein